MTAVASDTWLRAVWDAASDAMALSDERGIVIDANPAYQALYGYAREEVMGKSFSVIFPEAERPGAEERYREVFASESVPAVFESTVRRKDGETRIVESRIEFLEEGGRRVAMLSTIRDVTDARRREHERAQDRARRAVLGQALDEMADERDRALAAAQALAAERTAVLDQTADGVIVAGAEGRLVLVNDAARRLHGVRELDVAVDDYSATYHLFTLDGEPHPPHELPLARAVQRGETVTGARWLIRRPDGSEIVAEGSAAPVVLPNGTRYGSVLVMRDVSDQVALDRQKDEFLGSLSHDLKTPLTTVRGTAQLLARQLRRGAPPAPATLASSIGAILSAAEAMATQLDAALDAVRLRMGRPLSLLRQRTDLVPLARELVDEHRYATDRHRLVFQAHEPSLTGTWDGPRLRRVLRNLLANALAYSPDGDISLDLRREDDAAVITVCDQGLGIPAADLPRVFDRFHRGANVDGRIAGTGIGLADARQVVEQHGGAITAESTEGAGTCITVRLPL